ncbi:MAG TPA: hypothetical protein VHL11_02650 [Phototrophicaceae bacterium]|nr:hypothetical protein [Phototrophicaceae bacterium]
MKSNRIAQLMPYLVAGCLLLPLLAHLYLGQFNRAMADDFCFTAIVQAQGIGGALDHWYNNWTGTYSSTFFQSMVGLAQAWRWVPIALVTLWLLAVSWTAFQLATVLQIRQRGLVAVTAGALLVYAANDGAPNLYQSLYWTSGAITYSLPLIILTFNLGVIILGLRTSQVTWVPVPHTALSAGLCMLAGGFSPLFAVFQVTLFGLLFLGSLLLAPPRWKRRMLVMFGNAALFAFIALIILYIAPGNATRRSRFTLESSLIKMLSKAFDGALAFIPLSSTILSPMAILTALVVGGTIGLNYYPLTPAQRRNQYSVLFKMGIVIVTGFILIYVSMLTAVVSINALPPARGYIVPQTVLVAVVLICGFIAGSRLQPIGGSASSTLLQMIGRGLVLMVLIIGPVLAAVHTLSRVPDLQIFANEWDTRNTEVEAIALQNPQEDVVVEPFTVDFAKWVDVNPLRPDKQRNTCVADYYRIKSIRTSS